MKAREKGRKNIFSRKKCIHLKLKTFKRRKRISLKCLFRFRDYILLPSFFTLFTKTKIKVRKSCIKEKDFKNSRLLKVASKWQKIDSKGVLAKFENWFQYSKSKICIGFWKPYKSIIFLYSCALLSLNPGAKKRGLHHKTISLQIVCSRFFVRSYSFC